MNFERWAQLMSAWGFPDNEVTFASLSSAYSERGRYYHTRHHIDACLRHVDRCIRQFDSAREVELALWFHDAVYNPLSATNERESAGWAAAFLRQNHAPSDEITRIDRLVMVTKHDVPTHTKDESLLVDIDLSILGAEPAAYDTFEQDVRNEYRMVPSFIYNKKRAELLRHFLARPRIYANEPFVSEREQQARSNLSLAITKLEGVE